MIKTRIQLKPNNGMTLNQQIKNWMVQEFSNFSLDEKLPTDRALACDLKVSPVTINKAMNELCREGYIVRRRGQGTFLASRERLVFNEKIGNGKNGQIIIAYPNYFSSEYWTRVHCAEELAVKNAYDLIEYKLNRNADFDNLVQIAKQQKNLKGILLKPIPASFSRELLKKIDNLDVPVVLFGECNYIGLGKNFVSLTPDFFKTDYMKLKYLLDHGHREIAIISNEPHLKKIERITPGYKQALDDCGLNSKTIYRSHDRTNPWQNSAEAGYFLTKNILEKEKVTGMIFASIVGALGGMRYLWEQRLRVPDDVSIISTGTYLIFEDYMPAPLTVVRTSIDQQMKTAFEIFERFDEFPSKIILSNPELIERMSVKKL